MKHLPTSGMSQAATKVWQFFETLLDLENLVVAAEPVVNVDKQLMCFES